MSDIDILPKPLVKFFSESEVFSESSRANLALSSTKEVPERELIGGLSESESTTEPVEICSAKFQINIIKVWFKLLTFSK